MIAKWSRLDWLRRMVLFEAAAYLTVAYLALSFLPFRWTAARLGSLGGKPIDYSISTAQRNQAEQVGWAVTAIARRAPWDTKCLDQAVAGKWMLQRRGLPSLVCLGVDHGSGEEDWLVAHAWLLCAGDFVTGEPQHERFKVLTAFIEDGR